jgi:prophage regulatory protein
MQYTFYNNLTGMYMTKILRFPIVIEKTGLSRSTIYLKVSKGDFPKPISLGPNSVGWLEAEIDKWINSKVSERDAVISFK